MRRYFSIHSLVLILISGCFSSCGNQPAQQEESVSTESIVMQADSLLRNVDIKWTEMEYADKALVENSKILADSIATLEGLNQSLYDSIPAFIEAVKSQTYDQQTMSNGENIDAFDGAVTNLVDAVQRLQQTTTGGADCVVCDGIFKVVQEIDNEYVIRRKKYDIEADKFNKFTEANQESLQQLNAEKYQKLPLFSIIE